MNYQDRIIDLRRVPAGELLPNPKNWRKHPQKQKSALAGVLADVGWADAVIARETPAGLMLIDGHLRTEVAPDDTIPVLVLDVDENEADKILVTHDPLAEMATTDADALADLLQSVKSTEAGLNDLLTDMGGLTDLLQANAEPHAKLTDRFGVPPFSVLDTRQGYWQDRKRDWLALGIQSEVGREHLVPTAATFEGREGAEYMSGRGATTGGSVFDPVLCELMYSWFSAAGNHVLDPFAGGSVRGVVAGLMGRNYTGIELRLEQVKANRKQWKDMGGKHDGEVGDVKWIRGDSTHVKRLTKGGEYDLLFSCPPYGDLEVYSDDPADISNMPAAEFDATYGDIINESCKLLKDDTFAVFVVGEYRNKKGLYANFVAKTIQVFLDAGLAYYNEGILVNAIGSLPVRVNKPFTATRKLGKTHQNILVFVKGDAKKATSKLGDVVLVDITAKEDANA